jgi:hypothetical protein
MENVYEIIDEIRGLWLLSGCISPRLTPIYGARRMIRTCTFP